MKIFKYSIPIADKFRMAMPANAKILSFQIQNGNPVIWAEVDEYESVEDVDFYVRGTGQETPSVECDYIGTAQQGSLVWHLYKRS